MTVNLRKGEKISLLKTSENHLNHVFMGLGWAARQHGILDKLLKRDAEIDLDASCLMFDKNVGLVDIVFYNRLQSLTGSVFHSGDNRVGSTEGAGDDEVINVHLDDIPTRAKYLVFTVTSYEGQTFNQIQNAYCRLVDDSNQELVHFTISGGGSHTAILMAILYRSHNEWKFKAVGEPYNFRDPVHMAPACMAYLSNMDED